MTTATRSPYLPAAGHDLLLPFYDAVTRAMGIEGTHAALLEQAQLALAARVLDVGCGTGSLLIALKQGYPELEAVGADPDPKALARARQKAGRAGVNVSFDCGFGSSLPYPEQHFDRVLSSFMFHHLPPAERPALLSEVLRVLKPGGRLELVDFAGPDAGAGVLSRWLHSQRQLAGNAEGTVLGLLSQAGFSEARVMRRDQFPIAAVRFYQATRA